MSSRLSGRLGLAESTNDERVSLLETPNNLDNDHLIDRERTQVNIEQSSVPGERPTNDAWGPTSNKRQSTSAEIIVCRSDSLHEMSVNLKIKVKANLWKLTSQCNIQLKSEPIFFY